MADHSESSKFQALFDRALQDYEKKTSVKLAEHPLAIRLQGCHTVEDITSLLQGQAQDFSDFRENDKIIKSIKTIVSVLTPLSSAASLAAAFGVVCQVVFVKYFIFLTIL
jgi:hypothetical protein